MSTSEKILRIMFCVIVSVLGAAAAMSVLNRIGQPGCIGGIFSIILGYIGACLIAASSLSFGVIMLSDIVNDDDDDKEE